VNVTASKPPDQVRALRRRDQGREDNERVKNEAQAYANEVVPKRAARPARVVEDAKAHAPAWCEARVKRSASSPVGEYEKAPAVTSERLYLETARTC